MNGFVDIVEYLVQEHSVSLNTAAIPVGDVALFADTKSVSKIYYFYCVAMYICMYIHTYMCHAILGTSATNSFCKHLWTSRYDQNFGEIRSRSKINYTR